MIAAKNGEAMRQPAENPLALLCTNFLLQKYTYGQGMQKQAKQCSDMHVTTTLRLQSLWKGLLKNVCIQGWPLQGLQNTIWTEIDIELAGLGIEKYR
jgi:hypothetical protein